MRVLCGRLTRLFNIGNFRVIIMLNEINNET
jgi:hypothetical protein